MPPRDYLLSWQIKYSPPHIRTNFYQLKIARLISHNYHDQLSIRTYNSHIPGPSVGILAITHGNEPVGLEVFSRIETFLREYPITQGSLTLVPMNIEAYLHLDASGKSAPVRFVDADMNRIWGPTKQGTGREFIRRNELLSLISSFDFALDIHSVSEGDFCAGITNSRLASELFAWCDVPYLLIGASDNAVIGSVIRAGGKGFGMEAGNHSSPDGGARAWENTLRFLKYTQIFTHFPELPKMQEDRKTFSFLSEMVPKTDDFRFLNQTLDFHPVNPGETYASDGEFLLQNTTDHVIFTGIRSKNLEKGVSAGFLFLEHSV